VTSLFRLESNDGCVVVTSGERRLRVSFMSESVARVTYMEGRAFQVRQSLIVTSRERFENYRFEETADLFVVSTAALMVTISKKYGALRFLDVAGKVLMQEPERGGKWLTSKDVTRNIFSRDVAIEAGQSIDGARANVQEYVTEFDRSAFEAKLEFVFAEDEALFGLGSHEEGYGNLRGRSRELYQQNMKAVVPYFVSTRGYGVLLDCCSLMTFHDDAQGSYWWADVVDELDYYVIQGATFDDLTRGYHGLTGAAPMLPKWAFGYVQSKERYVNAAEVVEVVREYRRRRIPLDGIVLDWKSWPNGSGWGQKSFDAVRFPDPKGFIDEVHAMDARLMVSIWPIMTGDCADQRELLGRDLMLGNQSTYNAFLPEARDCYWGQAERGLFAHGVDAWWCDCTEPFEADWAGAVKPEPHARLAINTQQSKQYLDAGAINAYSLLHSQGIYEGQRSSGSAKRVVNLTRSSYAGQHRYGTITWNGDICGTWETLRRCIPEGLNFCATGEAYWTVDIGGFFVDNKPELWFWRGDYSAGCRGLTDMTALEPDPNDGGCLDLGYWELYTRWLQYAVFLPMFRSHGTDASREIWRFGEEGSLFYDVIAKYIRLRYQLLPYIYSLAAGVTRSSYTLMRALALDFPDDSLTHDVEDEYMFGPALLVCPVTRPMYYGVGSAPIVDVVRSREVYLPAGCGWFDLWSGAVYVGGQLVVAEAPLEVMPLFVRAGSIVPMTEAMQFVDEVRGAPYEIRVYRGADAEFSLYEDAGDGYDYEQGAFAIVKLVWVEALAELRISARQGDFAELVNERMYEVVVFSEAGSESRSIRYAGDEVVMKFGAL
jgi:alpha-D-xyloside xylohydrolase